MNAEGPTPDVTECSQFLEFWMMVTGAQHVTLIAIIPDGATTARTFAHGSDHLAPWIAARQKAGCNVYFQPNETRPDCARKPSKADMVAALCRFADIDPLDEQFPYADERHRLARFAAHLIADPKFAPTVTIDSGNGLQPIWAIEREALSPVAITRIEGETKAIEDVLGAGGTHNIDRLLRLPGTVNFPNRKKVRRGRSISRALLIHSGANLYSQAQATALAEYLKTRLDGTDLVRPKPEKSHANSDRRADDANIAALIEELRAAGADKVSRTQDLPAPLQSRLQAALTARPHLADRWAGLVDDLRERGQDDSRSSADMSLAAMLKAAGFSHLETALILCAFPHGKVNGEDWSNDTARLREAARAALRSHDPRTEQRAGQAIKVRAGELHIATTAGEAAINAAGKPVYQRGRALVRPIIRDVTASHGRTTKAAGLGELKPHAILDLLSETAEWERYDGRAKQWVRVDPPMQVAQILLSRQGQWKSPPIAGVITSPTLRPDSSILSEASYDPMTKLYHVTDEALELHPELHRPTRELAERALEFLGKLLLEFPFVILEGQNGTRKHVAKAVALSALITPVVRGALSVAPLHAFRATSPGSGKSYLADVASAISTGRPCPVISAAPDEAETEKRIAGLLLAGYPLVSIDNVNGELGGDLLCQAIERPLIRIRPLGASDIIEIENATTLFATGNQMRVRGDMVRRTLISDLDANEERPELREFKADPVAMVLADRGAYVSACLIIARAYIVADKPGRLAPIASFGDWSDLVRSALVWLGGDDPALSMEAARADDPDLAQLRELLEVWAETLGSSEGFTSAEIAKKIEEHLPTKIGEPTEIAYPDLREALLRYFGERGAVNTRRFAGWLVSREGRIVGGRKFARFGTAQGGLTRWGVTTVERR